MALLKAGASAVEAVEMAIIVLEDAEITNAGYGSNMTLDGAVECDATIVNHLGRSGAVGAVARKSVFQVVLPRKLILYCRGQKSNLTSSAHS